jgi:AraC-like DNA-binding protein
MIVFKYLSPGVALQNYVRQYQIVGFEFNDHIQLPVKPYWPRPENCLAFYPRDPEVLVDVIDNNKIYTKPRAAILGQPYFVTNRKVGSDFICFQVVFQPGALYRLIKLPANEITHSFVDAEAIFSNEIKLVNARLSSTNDVDEMIGIVEDFLLYLIRKADQDIKPIDKVAYYLLKNPKLVSLDWLSNEACLSRKQFYRQFVARMGLSPKTFSRIVSFDNAVKNKNAEPDKDWLSIAIDLGYYDYQHLAKDFKEFTGKTPNDFILQDKDAPERSFGHKEA